MNKQKTITAAFPGKYIQGPGLLGNLTEYISKFGTNALILS